MGLLAQLIRRFRYGRPIVVVSGLPRSGTSLMMQMLQAGGLDLVTDAIRTPDENNPKGYFELEAVKTLDKGESPAWLAEARGKAVKVVSPLVRWLPESYNYRVIFMQRDLDEVIASQNKMLADRGVPADERQNERVKQLYRAHAEETLRVLRARSCFTTIIVDHRETIATPREVARRVGEFLGGGLDEGRMAAAADAALYRNRRPAEQGGRVSSAFK
jgi:hypothetical protein